MEGKGTYKSVNGKFMKAILKMIEEKEKGFLNMQMGIFIKASLKIIRWKEKEF